MPYKAGAIIGEAILDTKKWSTGITSMEGSFRSISRAGKAMGVAVAGYLTATTIAANAFQIEMANVSTVMGEATDSTQDLTLALLGLDPRLGKTIDLTESLYLAFSAGAEQMDEAMQTTVDSAKFAAAALTTSVTALDILTSATNAYGKEVVTTTEASDIFFKTIEEGKVTGDQLSATIGQSIPLYASAGVELEQLGSGIAALTKQGASASESTTQLNAIINAMLRPTVEMTKAIEDYGFTSGGALLKAEGLTGVLKLMEVQTAGNIDQITKLTPNIRAMRGILALTGVGGEIYTDVLNKMATATGATDRAFAKQERTFVTLKAELDKIAIVTGNIAKFFVDELAISLTETSTGILEFIMSAQGMELVGDIAGYTAGTFSLLKTMAEEFSVMLRSESIDKALDTIGESAITTAGSMEILTKTMEVGALVAVAFGEGFNTVGTMVDLFSKSTTAIFESLAHNFTGLKNLFKGKEAATAFIAENARLKKIANEAGKEFDEFVFGAGSDYVEVLKQKFAELQTTSEDTAKNLEISFTSSFNNTKESVLANWLEMITGMKKGTQEVAEVLPPVAAVIENDTESLLDRLKELWEVWGDFVTDIISTSLSSMQSISDLYYENQLDALTLATQKELDIWDSLHLERLNSLRDASSAQSAIQDGYRQDEIDSLTEQLETMQELQEAYEEEQLDALRELTAEQIALDAHRRDEYVTRLAGSIAMVDQLELAAFLANEALGIAGLTLAEQLANQEDAISEQFAKDEKDRKKELAALEKEIAAEKKLADDQAVLDEQARLEELAIAEQEYQDEVDRINQEALDDQNRIAKEQFEINKALSIASVVMDSASAIAGFWASSAVLGPVAGPIAATAASLLVGGMGVAQIGLINDQQFIPAREEGGMASGLTRVNEAGGEIITLPDNSQVIPNDISRQIADNAGTIAAAPAEININFYDTQISESVDIEMLTEEISYTLGKQLRRA